MPTKPLEDQLGTSILTQSEQVQSKIHAGKFQHQTNAPTRLFNWHIAPFFLVLIAWLVLFHASPGLADDAGFALSFDGEDDLVVVDETVQIMGSGWENTKTISLWVKPTGADTCTNPGVDSCDSIIGDRPRWWGISRGVVGGLDRIWVWNWDGNADAVGIEYNVDQWIHIALVHEAGQLRAYKFGVEVGSTPSGATAQPDTGAHPVLYIGGIIRSTANWNFSGEIDEVRLWNYARTPQQLTDDMYISLNGNETGLMAYYKMSDGSGETLTDDSVHSWDGILGGNLPYDPDSVPQWVMSGAFAEPPPTNTPTATSTASATPSNTPTPSPTASATPTATSTASATPTNTPTATSTASATPTNTPTATSTASATPTNTPTPTSTAGATPSNTPTSSPTATGTSPSPTATVTGTPPSPTATVTGTPPVPTATSEPTPYEIIYLPLYTDR